VEVEKKAVEKAAAELEAKEKDVKLTEADIESRTAELAATAQKRIDVVRQLLADMEKEEEKAVEVQ
jgi:hypothetical protein